MHLVLFALCPLSLSLVCLLLLKARSQELPCALSELQATFFLILMRGVPPSQEKCAARHVHRTWARTRLGAQGPFEPWLVTIRRAKLGLGKELRRTRRKWHLRLSASVGPGFVAHEDHGLEEQQEQAGGSGPHGKQRHGGRVEQLPVLSCRHFVRT